MSGTAPTSSLRKRPEKSFALTGSMWERPVRKQTIELTLEPRPRPGGRIARAEAGPRTSTATSRASTSRSWWRRKKPERPSVRIVFNSLSSRARASARAATGCSL